MPSDTEKASPKSVKSDSAGTSASKEDAETTAARKELRNTSISDTAPGSDSREGTITPTESNSQPSRPATPDALSTERSRAELKDLVSSPKKKRAHDEVEDDKIEPSPNPASRSAPDPSAAASKDRGVRSEPEKKRVRDGDMNSGADSAPDSAKSSGSGDATKSPAKPPVTSSSAFANSGFAKLGASTTSPFGALAASKASGFGSSSGLSASPFASVAAPNVPAAKPTLSFGQPAGASQGASPFSGLAPSTSNGGFGGGLGSALRGGLGASPFGSAGGSSFGGIGGSKLSSFAKPGGALASEKPAKPFGAPDSDAEDESASDNGSDDSSSEAAADNEESKKDDAKNATEDSKKPRLQRVVVNDGEAGEVTIVQVRAKMFHLEKGAGWKERGAGMLKINVPEDSVEVDDTGAPKPGSFDASVLSDDDAKESKRPRLIMRQDQTHKVILNTVLIPAMQFEEKTSLKAVGVMFVAFEGEDSHPVNVHMRMSAVNARTFLNEVGLIQRELLNA